MAVTILAILLSGIVGLVLFRVAADQKAHSVVLTWNPSAPKPGTIVAGYNLYRRRADGPFDMLASGLTTPRYVDYQVRSGETYRYYVAAVDSAGRVSAASNIATAAIP